MTLLGFVLWMLSMQQRNCFLSNSGNAFICEPVKQETTLGWSNCHYAGGGTIFCENDAVKQELIDVPAIQEEREIEICEAVTAIACPDQLDCAQKCLSSHTTKHKVWTCGDRSRILLTAEDGTRHCIQFPK